MHLIQPEFTYSAGGSFTKNKEKLQKINETRDSRYINQNKLDKACFQHDMTHGDFKYLTRRIVFNNVLCEYRVNVKWCDLNEQCKIYKWDSSATWSLFAMIACIRLYTSNVESLSTSLREIPTKLIWEQ